MQEGRLIKRFLSENFRITAAYTQKLITAKIDYNCAIYLLCGNFIVIVLHCQNDEVLSKILMTSDEVQ